MARARVGQFKHELKIKPLPAAAEEYAKQYLINLLLQGYTVIGPGGATMNKYNIKEAMEAWK
jgi:hypothetical protein